MPAAGTSPEAGGGKEASRISGAQIHYAFVLVQFSMKFYMTVSVLTLTLTLSAFSLTACIGAGRVSDVGPVAAPGTTFPSVAGINLEGEEILLPDGFAGRLNLVAVAFEREQQADVDTWIGASETLASERDLRFYEVPTIYEAGAAFRLWVNNGMRAGIPGPEARARTITVYLDREAFLETLAIPDMTSIHVFLLDDAGRVLWRTAGVATADKLDELQRKLDTQKALSARDRG